MSKKTGCFWHFFPILMVFRSLCLSGAILAHQTSNGMFIGSWCIFCHPWDPWGRIHIDLNKNSVQTGCVDKNWRTSMIFKKFCLHKWLPCQTNILLCWIGYVQDLLELPFWCTYVINSYLLLSFINYVLTILYPRIWLSLYLILLCKGILIHLKSHRLIPWSYPPGPLTSSFCLSIESVQSFPRTTGIPGHKKKLPVFSLKHETSTERNDLFLKFDIDVRLDYYRNLSISVIKSFKIEIQISLK